MFEAPVPGTRAGDIIQVSAEGFMLHDRSAASGAGWRVIHACKLIGFLKPSLRREYF